MKSNWMSNSAHPIENPSLELWLGVQDIVGKPLMQFPAKAQRGNANFYLATPNSEKEWKMTDTELMLVGFSLAEMLSFFQFSDPFNVKNNVFSLSTAQVGCEFGLFGEFPARHTLGFGVDPTEVFTYEQSFSHAVTRNEMLMLGINHLENFLALNYQIEWRVEETAGNCYCLEKVQGAHDFRSEIYLEPLIAELIQRLDVIMGEKMPCLNATGYFGHIDQRIMAAGDHELGEVMETYGLQLKRREVKYPRLILFSSTRIKK